MRTGIKRGLFIVFLILLITWMAYSTRIITEIVNRKYDVTIAKVEPMPITQGVSFYQIDACETTTDTIDMVRLAGYIYNISDATDEQSTKSLILASDNAQYSIAMSSGKSYAWKLFTDIDITSKVYAGFGIDFCPLGLPDDKYHLVLQIEEDGIPVVRADTGYVIDKMNGHAYLMYQPSEPAELPPEEELRKWINCGLNVVEIDSEGNLNLTGWAIRDGKDASELDVLIGVRCGDVDEMRVYSTTKESITYIADYFDNDLYYNAGFRASIPDVTQEGLRVYVFARQGEETYRSSYHFEPDGGLDNMVFVSDIEEIVHGTYAQGRMTELPVQEELLGWTNGGIDYIELDDEGNLFLSGWTAIDQVDSEQVEALVGIQNSGSDELRVYAAAKKEATYIADYFGDERYLYSGFQIKISNVVQEGLKVYLYSRHEGKTYKCSYHFESDSSLEGVVSVSDIAQ